MTGLQRALAGAAACVALVSIIVQVDMYPLISQSEAPLPQSLWAMSGFYTILSNAAAAGILGLAALRGRMPRDGTLAALTQTLVLVAAVYHLVLADLWNPQGLHWWTDVGLHTVVPLACLALFLTRAGRMRLPVTAPVWWLGWPALYAVWAMGRGALTGNYPYPFLDVTTIGVQGVAVAMLAIAAGFAVVGWMLWGLNRLLAA
jgi:hypothetical protein